MKNEARNGWKKKQLLAHGVDSPVTFDPPLQERTLLTVTEEKDFFSASFLRTLRAGEIAEIQLTRPPPGVDDASLHLLNDFVARAEIPVMQHGVHPIWPRQVMQIARGRPYVLQLPSDAAAGEAGAGGRRARPARGEPQL